MTTIIITECKSPWGKYWNFKVKGTGKELAEVDKRRKSSFGYDAYVTYAGECPSEAARHSKKAMAMEFAKECCRRITGDDCEFKLNVVSEREDAPNLARFLLGNTIKTKLMSKAIEKIKDKLEVLQGELTQMAEEAQDYYDSRSERWQESDKASELEEKIDALTDAADSIGDAIDYIADYV